jgi:hypothetical protein
MRATWSSMLVGSSTIVISVLPSVTLMEDRSRGGARQLGVAGVDRSAAPLREGTLRVALRPVGLVFARSPTTSPTRRSRRCHVGRPGGTALVFRGDLRRRRTVDDLGRFTGVQMVGPAPSGDMRTAEGRWPRRGPGRVGRRRDIEPPPRRRARHVRPREAHRARGPSPRTVEMGTYLGSPRRRPVGGDGGPARCASTATRRSARCAPTPRTAAEGWPARW